MLFYVREDAKVWAYWNHSFDMHLSCAMGFSGGASGQEPVCQYRRPGLILGSGRSPGGGHSKLLQYSCLENPMDRGAWWTMAHRITKSRTQLKWLSSYDIQFHHPTKTHPGSPSSQLFPLTLGAFYLFSMLTFCLFQNAPQMESYSF